jgi:hypothetical protein
MATSADGAAGFVTAMVNNIESTAAQVEAAMDSVMAALVGDLNRKLDFPLVLPPVGSTLGPNFTALESPVPVTLATRPPKEWAVTQDEIRDYYGEHAAAALADLTGKFSDFLTQNFTDLADYTALADAWASQALTAGGSGLDATVERELWQREAARTLREESRAMDEAGASWAALGASIPAAATTYQKLGIASAAKHETAEGLRERAIFEFQAEQDNIQAALTLTLNARREAFSAAIGYMQAAALTFDQTLRSAQNMQTAHQRMNDTFLGFFKTDLQARSLAQKFKQTDRTARREWDTQRQELDFNKAAALAGAAATKVQSLAAAASSAVNAVHAQASISGSDVTTIQL